MRRERTTIVGDLLELIAKYETRPEELQPTRLAMRLRMSYDRCQTYLDEAQERALVTGQPFKLTPQGRDLLVRFAGLRQALRLYGLEPETPD